MAATVGPGKCPVEVRRGHGRRTVVGALPPAVRGYAGGSGMRRHHGGGARIGRVSAPERRAGGRRAAHRAPERALLAEARAPAAADGRAAARPAPAPRDRADAARHPGRRARRAARTCRSRSTPAASAARSSRCCAAPRPGPSVLVRADMDALPLHEDTGLPFASEADGAMHACGHDLHTAMLASAARLLAGRRERLAGTVVFMFQPGEESSHGARTMIAEGLPRPTARAGRPSRRWPCTSRRACGRARCRRAPTRSWRRPTTSTCTVDRPRRARLGPARRARPGAGRRRDGRRAAHDDHAAGQRVRPGRADRRRTSAPAPPPTSSPRPRCSRARCARCPSETRARVLAEVEAVCSGVAAAYGCTCEVEIEARLPRDGQRPRGRRAASPTSGARCWARASSSPCPTRSWARRTSPTCWARARRAGVPRRLPAGRRPGRGAAQPLQPRRVRRGRHGRRGRPVLAGTSWTPCGRADRRRRRPFGRMALTLAGRT